MFSRLETQFVDEKPQVLLISEPSGLGMCLKPALEAQDLDVVRVSAKTLATGATLPASLTQLYKIVWVHEPFESVETAHSVLQWLTERSEPKVVITTLLSPIAETKPIFDEWFRQAQADSDFVTYIQEYLPGATLLVGQDVHFSSKTFAPLTGMVSYLDQRALVDPEVVLTLQTAESFCRAIQPNLLSPLPHRLIVQGRRVVSTELLKKLQRLYQRDHGVMPALEAMPVESSPLPALATVQNPDLESLEKYLDDVPRLYPIKPLSHASQHPAPNILSPLPAPEKKSPTPAPSTLHPVPSTLSVPPLPDRATRLPVVEEEPSAPPLPPRPEPVKKSSTLPSAQHPALSTLNQDSELENQVVELFQKYRSDHKVKRVQNLAHTTKTVVVKQKHKKKLFWAGLSFVGAGFGVMAIAAFFVASQWWLKSHVFATVVNQLEKPDVPHTQSSLALLSNLVQTQVSTYTLVLEEHFFDQPLALARVGEVLATVPVKEQAVSDSFVQATAVFLGKNDGQSLATWETAALQAKELYETYSQVQASLKALAKTAVTSEQQAYLTKYDAWLVEQKRNLLPSQQLQPLLPSLLGEETKRTYAIVLQNNQELRPTGGFIQAVGLVTLDKGMVIDTQVVNVYDLDKKVLGAVAPPAELTRYLGEQQWFLRDSNWNPDFPAASTQMSWFIEKSTGKKVDGVVGINLQSVKSFLKVLGPLDLPEYNEVITDRNLDERMEFHSEIQLVPDSSKPDYSTLVLTKLLQKIQQTPQDKMVGLLTVAQGQLQDKQLLFTLMSQDENPSLTALGWTGALVKPSCPTQLSGSPCFVDTVAQVETNVGVNKANAYITRTTKHDVSINREGFRHVRTMNFANSATSPAWPKGTYKNFLRLYVSPEAELKGVKVNDVAIKADQLSITIENKRKVFGFLVEVPVSQKAKVEVEYQVPYPTSGSFSYTLFDQRQPGIEDPQLKIDLSHGKDLRPALIAPQAEVKNNTIHFDTTSLSHTFVGVQFN